MNPRHSAPSGLTDRFLHHGPFHRFLTYNGRKVGTSLLNNIISAPDTKLCAAFAAAATGMAAMFAPEHLVDAATYTGTALVSAPLIGTIFEGLVTVPYMKLFFDRRLSQRANAREWGMPYVIDKTPDGVNGIATPREIGELAHRHRRMFRTMAIIGGGFGIAFAAGSYKYGYNPKVFLAAPVLGALSVRFLSAAERFERLRDGTYKLVKLPIQPVSVRNPAP